MILSLGILLSNSMYLKFRAEIGANLVSVSFTNYISDFAKVISCSSVPILVAGGKTGTNILNTIT